MSINYGVSVKPSRAYVPQPTKLRPCTNCPNCGAPRKRMTCEYCDSTTPASGVASEADAVDFGEPLIAYY